MTIGVPPNSLGASHSPGTHVPQLHAQTSGVAQQQQRHAHDIGSSLEAVVLAEVKSGMVKENAGVVSEAKGKQEKTLGEGKPSKKNTNYCHRCCSKGHVLENCTTEIFCHICESDEHVAAKCPLRRNRPVAHLVGSGIDNLGFFLYSTWTHYHE